MAKKSKPKNRKKLVNVVIILLIVVVLSLFSFDALTGFVALGGGETHGAGGQESGNPHYGAIKGYVTYVLRDTDNSVIESSAPTEPLYVYFTPSGADVNWSGTITCDSTINGTLTHVDADDSSGNCTEVNYQTPTLYDCSAVLTNGSAVTIYRTNTSTESGNEGCFASKTPIGSYDIYV